MKRSVKVRVISLIVATVVLGGAVTAAAFMGSPYETIKKALLDAMTYRNATMESQVSMSVNGVQMESSKSYSISGDNSSLRYYFDANGDAIGYNYYASSLQVAPARTDTDTQWYYAQVYPGNNYYVSRNSEFAMLSPEDRNSAQMRFVELLADLIVGDLKNNIAMTSESGIRKISGTLTGSQVPELVKAGIDVLIEQSGGYHGLQNDVSFDGEVYIYEQMNIQRGIKTVRVWKQTVEAMSEEDMAAWENGRYYYKPYEDNYCGAIYIDNKPYHAIGPQEIIDECTIPATRADYGTVVNPMDLPMKSLVIDNIHGEAEVDANGNLLYLSVNGAATVTNIFDDVSVIELSAVFRFSDVGTSNPACPIPGAEQLFTEDYMKNKFGTGNIGVYFKLNPDGSIDEGSVTTAYPGELLNKYNSDRPSAVIDTRYPPMPVPAPVPEPPPLP